MTADITAHLTGQTCHLPGAQRRRDESGSSIFEVVVAVGLLVAVVSALAVEMGSGLDLARNNRNRSIAANLASREMDLVRSAAFASLPQGRTTSTVSVDGVSYTVDRDTAWVAQDSTTGLCDADTALPPQLLKTVVTVRWPQMAGVTPVRSETALSPPVAGYDPYKGNLAIELRDRNADPLAGQLVTVTGPESHSQATTSDGCAFFARLPAGDYSVRVDSPGFVDNTNQTPPSTTAHVSVGTTTPWEVAIDHAGSVRVQLIGQGGGVVPADVPLSLDNAGVSAKPVVVAGSGVSRLLQNLFPYESGYEIWAGSCADADPEGRPSATGSPFYPGASRSPAVAVMPGSLTTTTIAMPSVLVTVRAGGGDGDDEGGGSGSLAALDVVAQHSADSACSAGSTLALGKTGPDGTLLTALPYGSWTVQVSGPGFSPETANLLLTPTSPAVTSLVVSGGGGDD